MTFQDIQESLRTVELITCSPQIQGSRIGLRFSQTPPQEPGVYVVYLKVQGIAFYVGEAGNLLQRLTYLFRCHRNENPHPCHLRYRDVWDELPECETFCEMFGVRWHSTKGAFGRLEAEEGLQTQFGTNVKAFYMNFEERLAANQAATSGASPQAVPSAGAALPPDVITAASCPAFESCGSVCPVWRELTTNPAYHSPEGFMVPTMGYLGQPLRFRCLTAGARPEVHVWRPSGQPDFTFDEPACRTICQRFAQGINEGRSFVDGGTSYFNQPQWDVPPLGMIKTPFAAAIIRHARECAGLPI
jgi:hypothetical protein